MNVGPVSEMMPVSPLAEASVSGAQNAFLSTQVAKTTATTTSREKEEPSKEEMKRMVEEMQRHIERMNVNLKFTTYGEHGERIAIVVMNGDTGEVIREIPPEEIQALYERMSELVGMIFNRNA
ncbi:MAG: flagellar protein FlaG [Syntrophales bacterium]|nr:flagellar protein FlaG [Syntrophales bacterium]